MNNKKTIVIASSVLIVIIAVAALIIIPTTSSGKLKSANYSVDKKTLECYINVTMNEYITDHTETYGESYLKNIKLDPEKPLKSQESCYEGTWYDYFRGRAVEALKIHLVYCEAAKKQGIKLSSDELRSQIEYINDHYTGKEDKKSIENIAKITGLGLKYLDNFKNNVKITDADKENFIKEHPEEILCVDYGMIEIVEDMDFDMAACEKLAAEIKDSFDKNGFDNTIKNYNNNTHVEITDEKLNVIGYRFSRTTQFGDWAFNENRKAGESVVFRGSSQYSVYYLKNSAYKFDYTIRECEYIRVSNSNKEEQTSLVAFYKEYEKDPTDEKYNSLLKKYKFKPLKRAYNAEDIAPELRNYIYNSDNDIGDFNLVQNGSELYFIKLTAEKGSYFDTTVKNNFIDIEVSKNLAKLQKEYPVKGK